MTFILKYLTAAAAITALIVGLPASAQDLPEYEISGDNAIQIETFAGLTADDWAAQFIGLAQLESGVAPDRYTYDPNDLEAMRLYIWNKLEDLSVDLMPVVELFNKKAYALDDKRNIKIATMLKAYLKAQQEPLSPEDYDARISDLTRNYASDNDWFVVFYANALNFEAGLNEGIFDPIYANFADFALRGHEADLDHDEARLIYLRMRIYDYLGRYDLDGFYKFLSERNRLKARFGLPNSDFADLMNAASLHHTIFTDPSSIRIAEEAFHNDDLSPENNEAAKFVLGELYTAHGFSDKALEVYKSIELMALPEDRDGNWLVQSVDLNKALNYALLGDMDGAQNIFDQVNETEATNYGQAKFQYDLLKLVLNEPIMTPAKKADMLETIKTFRNVNMLTRLEMAPDISPRGFNRRRTPVTVDLTEFHQSGDIADLQPSRKIDRDRIKSFIILAGMHLRGSSKTTIREKTIAAAMQALGTQTASRLTDLVRQLRQDPDDEALADLFDVYRRAEANNLENAVAALESPEHKTIGKLLLGRFCVKQADYACAWEHLYGARQQARSVGQSGFVNFLITDTELSLMSHENNTSEVLRTATTLFETQNQFIADPDMAYDMINRVAGAFERTGLTGTAYKIIALDGEGGMGQPYANHMTEVRLMLALSRYREARDRLDTLILEGGSLRESLYEKALNYAAHAALGEIDEARFLAEEVRTGIQGLKDPLLSALVEPYLIMGDYHVYTHIRPFEAEGYRTQYQESRRAVDALQVEKSRRLAEARVRAINAAEIRALDLAQMNVSTLKRQRRLSSSILAIFVAVLLGGAYHLFRLFRRNQKLALDNQRLEHTRRTHEYFMDEMERQTALETTALTSAMDTMARSTSADPQLMSEKLSGHVTSLKENMARLAFQDRVFTRKSSPPTKINLETLRADLLESWRPAASKKDISIMFDVDERVRSVHSYKALLTESLRLFVGHAIDHTSIDVITVKMTPFRIKDRDFIRAQISDEGDGLASFDSRLSPGDVSPDLHVAFDDNEKQVFAASTAIMAINGAGGRFESEATPGFGHVLTFDLPATLIAGADEPMSPNNIIEFKKGTANDG